MKNDQEKSDPSIVAKRPTNKPDIAGVNLWGSGRSRRSKGKGPRETRKSNARAGRRAGKACPRGSNVYFQAIFQARMPRSSWSHGLWFMTRCRYSYQIGGSSS